MVWGETYESEIVWIDDLEKLNVKYDFQKGTKPFIFARYEVYDETCEKHVKKFMSIKKAEARVERQLAYKKHAKCSIKILEDNLIKKVPLDFSNILGTTANTDRWNKFWYDRHGGLPINVDLITVQHNINMVATIKKIELDKNIVTKKDEPMRLTILILEDVNQNTTQLTLFNSPLADQFEEGQRVELIDASVNMRRYQNSDPRPEGISVPRWGDMKIISQKEFDEKIASAPKLERPAEPEPEVEKPVNCEQKNCAKRGEDQQFYCVNCDMELCSVCKFEHMEGYSLAKLTCDNEICYGTRSQNQL